jgi:hypothetical protein
VASLDGTPPPRWADPIAERNATEKRSFEDDNRPSFPSRNEPQRHTDTKKRKTKQREEKPLRKPGRQEKKRPILLYSWFPGFLSGISFLFFLLGVSVPLWFIS